MFTTNPFVGLSELFSAEMQQGYVVAMLIAVVLGTILDVMHKKSAKWFSENAAKAKESAEREVGGSEKAVILTQTVANEVLTSSEFANPQRRLSHLLTMYGFIIFVATTAYLVFFHNGVDGKAIAGAEAPVYLSVLWHLGALMLAVGGYWFWFFIRADVSSEGLPWYRLEQADLFIVSLLGMATFGLLWSIMQSLDAGVMEIATLLLFLIASTVLFTTVMWSKFAHMFFKPAAAYQKKITKADGSLENLPKPADRTLAADRDRHSMELLKDAPADMGLGIKREPPQHF